MRTERIDGGDRAASTYPSAPPRRPASAIGAIVEWPTLVVAAAIHGGWLALTWWWTALPTPVLIAAGAWLVAWHGSLQHETIHNHPTPWRRINGAVGTLGLSLWLPYAIYRRSHLAHHASLRITDPRADPESRYRADDTAPGRWLDGVQGTLLGRLAFGPALAAAALARDEARRLRATPAMVARDWLPHLATLVPIVGWLEWTGLGVGRYLLLVVYPGTALTLLRSFAEHRADRPGPSRAATVTQGGVLALLYLHNNLHAAHHERPGLAWYRLPAYQRRHAERLETETGRPYRGYGEIVRRFAFRRHDDAVHPAHAR